MTENRKFPFQVGDILITGSTKVKIAEINENKGEALLKFFSGVPERWFSFLVITGQCELLESQVEFEF